MKTKRWVSTTPKCEIVTATKELVDCLLDANVGNRRIRQTHIGFLKRQISEAHYVITNQGIGVDVNGRLIDSQHRLIAIKESGYPPVQLLIVYGLPTEAKAAIDIGLTRTITDLMHFAFERPEATAKMIAVSRFWGVRVCLLSPQNETPTPADQAEWYLMLLPAMERVFSVPGAASLPAPILTAVCYRMLRVEDDARPLMFVEKFLSGAGLEEGSPILLLRKWNDSVRGSTGGSVVQMERYERTASALAAYLEGRHMKQLKIRADATEAMLSAAQ